MALAARSAAKFRSGLANLGFEATGDGIMANGESLSGQQSVDLIPTEGLLAAPSPKILQLAPPPLGHQNEYL